MVGSGSAVHAEHGASAHGTGSARSVSALAPYARQVVDQVDRGADLSAVLEDLADADVLALLAQTDDWATSIGGSTARARLEGFDVFVKQLPLTPQERGEPTSTANRFDLPASCHYGITSPGFGAGREVAAHEATSRWVRAGVTDVFPLLHHWRVVDRPCRPDLSEFDDEEVTRRWGASWPRVRDRVAALRAAPSSVVLFLEHVPDTLGTWLRRRIAERRGGAAFRDALQQIVAATTWWGWRGLRHMDVHPGNILVRCDRLVFTDFGLTLHEGFAMDPGERAFLASHGSYDHDSGITSLLHWVLAEVGTGSRAQRMQVLRAAAADPSTPALDGARTALGEATDLIAEHATLAVATTERFQALVEDASAP